MLQCARPVRVDSIKDIFLEIFVKLTEQLHFRVPVVFYFQNMPWKFFLFYVIKSRIIKSMNLPSCQKWFTFYHIGDTFHLCTKPWRVGIGRKSGDLAGCWCILFCITNSPIIRQKGESQNECFNGCAYQGVRNVCFSEILACFTFLKRPFWDSPFCLITGEL